MTTDANTGKPRSTDDVTCASRLHPVALSHVDAEVNEMDARRVDASSEAADARRLAGLYCKPRRKAR